MNAAPCTRSTALFIAFPAGCARPRRAGFTSSLPTRRSIPAAAAPADAEIEGLSSDHCTDFVCTSSPAIEATVRSLARDLERANGVFTRSLFSAQKLEYRGFRAFKGIDGYKTLTFIPKSVTHPQVKVTGMKMIDAGTAEIKWTLKGSVGPTPVDVAMTTTIKMNLLTGQIEQHTDSWDLSRCSAQGALAFNAARAAYAVKAGSAAAAEATSSVLGSLSSVDEDEQQYMSNPNDPMKFFQQGDTFKDDAIMYIGGLTLAYVMWQAWSNLFQG